jgi:subtilisin family serine protease
LTATFGGQTRRAWDAALRGLLVQMSETQAMAMATDIRVTAIYQDIAQPIEEVLANSTPYCYPIPVVPRPACQPPGNWILNLRTPPPLPQVITCANPDPLATGCVDNWGLDRLDSFSVNRNGLYNPPALGTGVKIYLLDTGVRANNIEFGGRVVAGFNATYDEPGCTNCFPNCNPPCGTDTHDYHGHGTHVAAIAGGAFAGVAKNVTLVPVRFYDNQCVVETDASTIITGINWIVQNHSVAAPTAIVNLSSAAFGWATDVEFQPLRNAVLGLAARDNLLLVQSAGNGNGPTFGTTPYSCIFTFGNEDQYPLGSPQYLATQKVTIVGASDENDGRWRCIKPEDGGNDVGCFATNAGSNYGKCLDLFAPGAHVVSAWNATAVFGDEKAVCELSGTSMAAPHVSGIAALLLQTEPTLNSSALKAKILANARPNALEADPADPNWIGPLSPNLLASVWASDVLFADGFESGNVTAWSGSSSLGIEPSELQGGKNGH